MRIYIERLKLYFRLNPLIIILLLVGGILSICALSYTYGNLTPWTSFNSPEKSENRFYSLSFEYGVPYTELNDFIKVLETTEIYNVEYYTDPQEHYLMDIGDNEIGEISYLSANKSVKDSSGKLIDIDLETNAVYIPFAGLRKKDGSHYAVGNTIVIAGKDYLLKDISSNSAPLVSKNLFQDNDLKVRKLMFLTEHVLTLEQSETLLNSLYEIQPFSLGFSPSMMRETENDRLWILLLFIYSVLVVSIFSYVYLAKYAAELQLKNNAILRLFGISRKRMNWYIALDVVTFTFLTGIIGLSVYTVLFRLWLHRFMLYQVVEYSIFDYLLILLTSIALSFLVIYPSVLKNDQANQPNLIGGKE